MLFNIVYIVMILFFISVLLIDRFKKPQLTDEQKKKIKEWLLLAVLEAEKEFGEKTGQIKLRYVYDLFIKAFPNLINAVSFKDLSDLVDEVLIHFNDLMSDNQMIANYVKGGK